MQITPELGYVLVAVLVLAAVVAASSGKKDRPATDSRALTWMHDWGINMPVVYADPLVIELPQPNEQAGSAHYFTLHADSLAVKTLARMSFRVEAEPGVKILPREYPGNAATLSLYFQRRDINWSAETHRWWASFATVKLEPGEYTVEARFDQNWTAVLSSSREKNPEAFADALANAGRIGFTIGGGDGLGHGIYATGPARLVVTGFAVE
jgi:hypothetical protein